MLFREEAAKGLAVFRLQPAVGRDVGQDALLGPQRLATALVENLVDVAGLGEHGIAATLVQFPQAPGVLLQLHIRRVGDGDVKASAGGENLGELDAPVDHALRIGKVQGIADGGVQRRYLGAQAVLIGAAGGPQVFRL